MSTSITTTVTPTVITVTDAQDLANAIMQINASPEGTYDVVIAPTGGNTITLDQDLPILNAGNANVTFEGGSTATTLSGQELYRGLFVQSGDVTVQNLTITDALAAGGDGGSGIAAGGGGAGLGGGLFVGAAATVSLNNVNFTNDVAAGGNGGDIDTTATAGGGGGGMGGAGGDASDTSSQNILNVEETYGGYTPQFNTSVDTLVGAGGGGGGGGLGTTASGSSVLNGNGGEGDAPGEASGGGGGGQTESYQKTYFYDAYSEYGTDTSPSTGGGDYGGGGGFGNSEFSGGGGGGIGGQTSANYNTGQTVVVDETSELESILDEVYTVAKEVVPIIVPTVGIAFALASLATDVTEVAESGGFTLADGVELGSDAINLFVSAKAASAAEEGLDAAEDGSSLATDVRNLVADLKAYATLNPAVYTQDLLATFGSKLASVAAKQALKLAENTAMNLANGDPLGTSLAEAASHLVPLPGQDSDPTVTDSQAFVAGEPTAGGEGGFGGGGGGGAGVGGNGGFGGGGGGAGLPSTDEDFDGGDGGFGGGGGGGSLNAQGGTAGFGAGNGTNGYYYDPATGIYSPMPSQGGGGLGAGGGVFVQQGGTLTIGGNVTFSGNAAAGGIAYNSGLGLGPDLFEAGGGIITVDPSAGQTTSFGNLTDENASEAGYAADSIGLSVEGTGLVQLNGINTFSDQTLIGAQSVANAIAADPAGASSVVNGQLEITAGTTITSNIVLEAGATLIVDAGAVLIGSIDLSNISPGEPYTLSIAPTATLDGGIILPNAQDMSATTIAGVDEILADFAAQTVAALPSQPYVLGLNSATDLQAASGTIHVPILPNDQPLTIQAEAGGGTLAASNLVLADPSKGGGGLILAETSAADTLTIDASISDANAAASAGTPGYTDITVAGPGTTVLAGNNSFDGGVTLQAGTLDIDGNAHVGTITFAPTGSSAAPVVLSMALSAVPTSFAYQVGDLDGAFSEAGTFDFNDPIELPNITAPGSPLYGQLTPNIGNDDINDVFGVDGGVNALDPDFLVLAAYIGPYGSNPSPFTSNFAAILTTGSDGVATLSINPNAIEIRGFGSGTLTTGDSIEITNAPAPAQPMTLTSFAYNGDTLVAITLSNDTTGYIDFGTSIAAGTTFTLQAGPNGVATLTLATTAFTVAQSSDLSNALTSVTAATQAGTSAQSFLVTDNAYQVTLSAQTTQLGMGDSLVILGQGNEITTSNGSLTFDGPGTVAIGDATLNNVNVSSFVIQSYGIEVGSGTTVDLDQVSVEQEGIAVDPGGVLNVASSTFTEPSGALYNAIAIGGGAANVTGSTIGGTIEVTSGTLTLGDDNVVSGAIYLDQTNATLFIDPAVGATDTIDGAIIGAGGVVIGAPSTANGGLVTIAGASDYSGGTTVYADETVDVDSGATLGTGTVTIVGDRTELPMLAVDATLVLDGGSLPNEIDVTAPAAVIDIAANSTAAGEATLSVASGSALTVVGNGTTLDVSAASMGLDIAGTGTVTLEGITVTSTDGTALTLGDNAVGFGSGVTISGEIRGGGGRLARPRFGDDLRGSRRNRARHRGRHGRFRGVADCRRDRHRRRRRAHPWFGHRIRFDRDRRGLKPYSLADRRRDGHAWRAGDGRRDPDDRDADLGARWPRRGDRGRQLQRRHDHRGRKHPRNRGRGQPRDRFGDVGRSGCHSAHRRYDAAGQCHRFQRRQRHGRADGVGCRHLPNRRGQCIGRAEFHGRKRQRDACRRRRRRRHVVRCRWGGRRYRNLPRGADGHRCVRGGLRGGDRRCRRGAGGGHGGDLHNRARARRRRSRRHPERKPCEQRDSPDRRRGGFGNARRHFRGSRRLTRVERRKQLRRWHRDRLRRNRDACRRRCRGHGRDHLRGDRRRGTGDARDRQYDREFQRRRHDRRDRRGGDRRDGSGIPAGYRYASHADRQRDLSVRRYRAAGYAVHRGIRWPRRHPGDHGLHAAGLHGIDGGRTRCRDRKHQRDCRRLRYRRDDRFRARCRHQADPVAPDADARVEHDPLHQRQWRHARRTGRLPGVRRRGRGHAHGCEHQHRQCRRPGGQRLRHLWRRWRRRPRRRALHRRHHPGDASEHRLLRRCGGGRQRLGRQHGRRERRRCTRRRTARGFRPGQLRLRAHERLGRRRRRLPDQRAPGRRRRCRSRRRDLRAVRRECHRCRRPDGAGKHRAGRRRHSERLRPRRRNFRGRQRHPDIRPAGGNDHRYRRRDRRPERAVGRHQRGAKRAGECPDGRRRHAGPRRREFIWRHDDNRVRDSGDRRSVEFDRRDRRRQPARLRSARAIREREPFPRRRPDQLRGFG